VKSNQSIAYSEGPGKWSGFNNRFCPFNKVPLVADSSSFVTWLYWSAFGGDRDFLNNENWKTGNANSLGNHGTPVPLAEAQPGDIVMYGSAPYDHAAVYVGNNQVVTFEENGPAKLVPIDYRSPYIVRSYLPWVKG